MRQIETHLWKVPQRGKLKGYVSPVHRTAEEALAEYGPDATIVPNSMKLRQEPETDAERLQAMYHYQSAGHGGVKPPRSRE